MTQRNVLEITEGFHPLQTLCVEQFIANDLHFDGGMLLWEKMLADSLLKRRKYMSSLDQTVLENQS
jgi:hypothetical protein